MYVNKKSSYLINDNSSRLGTNNGKKNSSNNFEELLKRYSQNKDSSNEKDISGEKISRNVYGGQTTDRGTKIIQPGEDMDKNAFLRILAAQMANQDPTQPQDGTEYISQFAQFAAMEQMSNLNNTMSGFASQSLIGKGVMLNAYDKNGELIVGIVRTVAQSGSKILIGVEYLNEKGEVIMGEFEDSDIANVMDIEDNRLDYINNNMTMLVGSAMIGKNIKFKFKSANESSSEYEILNGEVKGVTVENNLVKLRVKISGSDEMKVVTLDSILEVDGEKYQNKF